MAIVLTSPPVIQSVYVYYDALADVPGTYVCVRVRGYAGLLPYDATGCALTPGETLTEDFFSSDIYNAVFDAYDANGITPGSFNFPPVAQDTTVWDPETNAPYP